MRRTHRQVLCFHAIPANIWRPLAYHQTRQTRKHIGDEEITSIVGPAMNLGSSGLGKTVLTRALGHMPSIRCYLPGHACPHRRLRAFYPYRGHRLFLVDLANIASTELGPLTRRPDATTRIA